MLLPPFPVPDKEAPQEKLLDFQTEESRNYVLLQHFTTKTLDSLQLVWGMFLDTALRYNSI